MGWCRIARRAMVGTGAAVAVASGACSIGLLSPVAAPSIPRNAPAAEGTLTISPTTGGLATVLDVTLVDAGSAGRFDRDTVVEWRGRYVPVLGQPSEPFTIAWRASGALECSPDHLRLRGIAGKPSGLPGFTTFLVPGRLEGTVAASLSSGERMMAPAVFAPFNNGIWRDVSYPTGPQGLDGPVAGDEVDGITIYVLSRLPSGANPDDNQLVWAASSMHHGLEVTAPLSLAERWPECVHVDICTTTPDQALLDRVTVPLYPQPIEENAAMVVYRSDLHRPIIFVDLKVDQSKHPRVTLVHAASGGTIGVTATLNRPPSALIELERAKVLAPVRTPGEALAAIHAPHGMSSARLGAAIGALRGGIDAEGGLPWEELVALITSDAQHFDVREALLKFVLDEGDGAARRRLLRALMVAPAPTHVHDRTDLTTWDWNAIHRGTAIRWLSERSTDALRPLQPEAGELLASVVETEPLHHIQYHVTLLTALPADAEWKSHLARRLIEVNHRSGAAGSPLVDLLGPREVQAFRTAVLAAPPAWQEFPSAIADALADLGDREILPELRRRAEGLPAAQQHRIRWWIRMIELQAEPADLVRFATEIAEHRSTFHRLWALQRALELGVSKDDIRTAILAYAETIRTQTDAARAESLEREALLAAKLAAILLSEFKQFGLDRGILREDDLPDVPLPIRAIGCG